MIKKLCYLSLAIFLSAAVYAEEKVVVQLKWEHEFQFAGFYAALWQGYYKEAGLDVELRSAVRADKSLLDPIDEVVNHRADFGVSNSELLMAVDRGAELSVLASVFQRSPISLFSLNTVPLNTPDDLRGKRIAAGLRKSNRAELMALLIQNNLTEEDVEFVDAPASLSTLTSGRADVIISYAPSMRYDASERGVALNELSPFDFGINFYGDSLFSDQQTLRNRPEMVEKFVAATLRGWRYALQNKGEIAATIDHLYNRNLVKYNDPLLYNIRFAAVIDNYIQYPQIPLGQSQAERWRQMNELMYKGGLVTSKQIPTGFFAENQLREGAAAPLALYAIVIVLMLLPVIMFFWYKRRFAPTLVALVVLILGLDLLIERSLTTSLQREAELSIYRQLTSVAARLEGDIAISLSLLNGFAVHISSKPNISHDEFDLYAQALFDRDPLLINFAAAKDLVVNMVYPMAGNERIVGMDYRKMPAQGQMVFQAIRTGETILDGPIQLVQGGKAFIGRAPVFYRTSDNSRKLWGVISAPIDLDALYRQAGISRDDDFNIAIRSFDPTGGYSNAFLGEDAVFNHADKLQTSIPVGGGSWQLAVVPDANKAISDNLFWVRLISLATLLSLVGLVTIRFRLTQEKHRYEDALLENQRLLQKIGVIAEVSGWKMDKDLQILQWNRHTNFLLGLKAQQQLTQLDELQSVLSQHDFKTLREASLQLFVDAKPFDINVELQSDAEQRWLRIVGELFQEVHTHAVCIVQDITERVKSTQVIKHQATYDNLTGLPNRLLFRVHLKKAIETTRREKNGVAVLFIDLDRFKPVNDNHGHAVGDKLLKEIAKRIQSSVREADTVARLSGDEFGVVVSQVKSAADVLPVIEKIIHHVQRPVQIGEVTLNCSCSIGIAMHPEDGDDEQALTIHADQAMYEVKNAGRNGWQFYTRELQQRSEHRHRMLQDLLQAIKSDQLTCFYQAIFDLQSRQPVRCEALCRWQRDDGNMVPTNEFIGLAEETGLINQIDLHMLKLAGDQLQRAKATGLRVGLSVNVSPRLFTVKDDALDAWLEQILILSEHLDLTVEITERLLTDNSERALAVLTQLQQQGVRIAIDDFGTGYSSLGYLVRFPVDVLKIDREFVSRLGQDKSAETLVETILVMAKRLNMTTVAEGIETEQQLAFLTSRGCDYGQGYLLARPMAFESFTALLGNHKTPQT